MPDPHDHDHDHDDHDHDHAHDHDEHDPIPYLEAAVEAGYHLDFSDGSQIDRVTSPDEVVRHYHPSRRVSLYRSHHVFLRPSVLGGGYRETDGGAQIDIDGLTFSVGSIEPFDDGSDTLYAEITEGVDDAHEAATHPNVPVEPGVGRGVALVHGFQFFNHVGWFCDATAGPSTGLTVSGRTQPARNTATIGTEVKIALLDNGVDVGHPWMCQENGLLMVSNDAISTPPLGGEAADDLTRFHGTMVAGVLRQAAPYAEIVSYDVTLPRGAHAAPSSEVSVVCENQIRKALTAACDAGVTIAVMAFGGEIVDGADKPDDTVLKQAVDQFVGDGERVIFAAAGNLFSPDETRGMMYPAAFSNVRAVAGGTGEAEPYSWSNSGAWVQDWVDITDVGDGLDRDGSLLTSCYGTVVAQQIGQPGGEYYVMAKGTSLLAPIAVGLYLGGQSPFPDYV